MASRAGPPTAPSGREALIASRNPGFINLYRDLSVNRDAPVVLQCST
jgi:hypothetical protein